MALMEWLSALHGSDASASRRRPNRGFPVAAEIFEDRAAPASLLAGLTPEFDGGLSAPIVEESQSDIETITFSSDETPALTPVEQPKIEGRSVAPKTAVAPSRAQILPSVLDELAFPTPARPQVLPPITSIPQLDVFNQVHQSAGPPAPPPAGLGGGTHAVDSESGAVASSPQFAFQTLSFGGNLPPTAYDDSYSASGTMTLADNVTNNDVDPEFDPLTATVVSGPSNGSFSYFNTDGSFEYIPNPGWAGTDTFTYKVNDGFQDSNIATVTIQVAGSGPDAIDDQAWTGANQTITIDVLHNDTGSGFFTILNTSGAMNGTANVTPDGHYITYTPNSTFLTGTDTFEYVIDNGSGFTDTGYVTVSMVEVTGWTLEWRNPGDELWTESLPEEAVWSHEELRWTAHSTLPSYQTSVDFYAQDWEQFENGENNWTWFADGSGDGTPEGVGKAFGTPGVGIWAIKAVVGFEVPHQDGFGVAMQNAAVQNEKQKPVAEIVKVEFVEHTDSGDLEIAQAALPFGPIWEWKFFPDAATANGPVRNIVDVKITIRPNVEATIHLKAFDVDDPSDLDGPIDQDPPNVVLPGGNPAGNRVTDPADNHATTGEATEFVLQATATTTPSILPGAQETSVTAPFHINWIQPGNNYRVAASPRNATELSKLKSLSRESNQVQFGLPSVYYDENNNNVYNDDEGRLDNWFDFNGMRVSELLTVWRILHVETDWMAAPAGNDLLALQGSVDDVVPNAALPKPNTTLLEDAFEAAYVKVVVGTPEDKQNPWDQNIEGADLAGRQNNRVTGERSAYWAVHVETAYEGPVANDNDVEPNVQEGSPQLAITDKPQMNNELELSYVFRETVRDVVTEKNPNMDPQLLPAFIDLVSGLLVLHEIGNQFELPSAGSTDVMTDLNNWDLVAPIPASQTSFQDTNILKIREILKP